MTPQRRALAVAVVLAVTTLGVALPAAPALADAALAEANPAEGAILDAAPSEIVLTFNEELFVDALHEVSVTDPSGVEVTTGEAVADGNVLTVPIDAAAEGAYMVTWSTVSIDTHRISDTYQFGVGEGVVLEDDGHAEEVPYRDQQIVDPVVLVVAGGLVLLAIVAILAVILIRTRRSNAAE